MSPVEPRVRPRLAVVSPFLDKRHGTELCVAEQIERLAETYEIHLYSARVEDVDLTRVVWHRMFLPFGPHLLRYVWWFIANQVRRWWDSRVRGLTPEIVYSPGINCLDADVISVHIVFAEFRRQVKEELRLRSNPLGAWPRLIHRLLYYRAVEALERRVYGRSHVPLAVVSEKVAADLVRSYGRKQNLHLIYHGCDAKRFQPKRRCELRVQARSELGLHEDNFAVLLVGNDWKKKGLRCLLEAVALLGSPDIRVLVVGKDDKTPYRGILEQNRLTEYVRFLAPRRDVEFYYSAADLYVGPSLEDAFALPPIEAMACGVPVIVSRQAGVSEVIHHGEDGLILEGPTDAQKLSEWISSLLRSPEWRQQLGDAAARTAAQYTWDRNAQQLHNLLEMARLARTKRRLEPEHAAQS